jgi:hypothetical protein
LRARRAARHVVEGRGVVLHGPHGDRVEAGVREPDWQGTLPVGAPSMAWTEQVRAMTTEFARMTGIPESQMEGAQEETQRDFDALGREVRIWKIRLQPMEKRKRDHRGGIASYVVNGPFNIMWQWWLVGMVHLRPIEGVKPPHLLRPDATHEFLIASIHPDERVDIDRVEKPGFRGLRTLDPIDVQHQLAGLTDAQAEELGDLCMQAVVRGMLSPDQDWRRMWVRSLEQTAEHVRTGGHAN